MNNTIERNNLASENFVLLKIKKFKRNFWFCLGLFLKGITTISSMDLFIKIMRI